MSVQAQVRNAVAIVRPQLTYEGTTTYLYISDYFKKENYQDISDYFRSMTKGGHGSGYLTKDAAGRTLVITAKHVVVFSDKASLEIQKDNGKVVKITDCPIIYRDDDVDFAVVLVPPEKTADLGDDVVYLQLADGEPTDGTEVWSAGYPALLNQPAWQLGKGNITNHRLVVEALGLAESSVFIQHTAPIDPGNSGGPLLIGDPKDPASMRVLGINTWMALGRQSANFAVSIQNLKEAFGRIPAAEKDKTEQAAQVVESKARELIVELNKAEWSRFGANRYVSYKMAAKLGWNTFTEGLREESESSAKDWAARLFSSTVETLRQFLYLRMHKVIYHAGTPLEFVGIQPSPDISNGYRVEMVRGKDKYSMDWVQEAGSWHVAALILPSGAASGAALGKSPPPPPKPKEPVTHTPTALLLTVGVNVVPLITGWEPHAGVGLGYTFGVASWLTFGGYLDYSSASSLVSGSTQEALNIMEATVFMHFNLPIGTSGIFPYLSLGASGGIEVPENNPPAPSLAANGGIGFCLSTAGRISFGVEVLGRFGIEDTVIPRLENIAVGCYLTL